MEICLVVSRQVTWLATSDIKWTLYNWYCLRSGDSNFFFPFRQKAPLLFLSAQFPFVAQGLLTCTQGVQHPLATNQGFLPHVGNELNPTSYQGFR